MSDLIKGQAKLSSYIDETVTAYKSAGRRVHIAVVSAIHHAATSGDPTLLNRLFVGLRPNDQTAVRNYVRRAAAIIGFDGKVPDMQPVEVVQGAIEAGKVLDFKQGEFLIAQVGSEKRGHNSKQAKQLAELCEKRFINPDGKTDKFVLDRDNIAEVRTLGDQDMLKSVIALAKRLDSDSERRKMNVSKKVSDMIRKFGDQAETMLGQTTLSKG